MTDLHALPAALIVPPEKAGPFLRTLGIDLADLYASIAAGEAAAAGLDGFAPPMASGIVRWISVVSAVRRGLAESGEWIPGERRGQPVSRHLASGRTLTVMSGDVATGNPEFAFGPHTVRRKGAATADSFQPDEVLFPLSELCPSLGSTVRSPARGSSSTARTGTRSTWRCRSPPGSINTAGSSPAGRSG